MFGFQSGPIQDSELDHLRQLGKPMPGGESRHVVFADEINELRVRLANSQGFHGVDSIGWRGALELQSIETELRFAFDGSAQHFDAGVGRRWCAIELVRRNRCGNEEQLVQLELFNRVTRQN